MKFWQWWVLVVIVASGPWFGIVREPQWQRVTWIPFTGAEDKPRDVVENFLMFVPFGLSFASGRRRAHPIAAAIAASAIVSLAVEIPQLFYRLRDPSATDVFMAMCGTAAGSVAAQAFQRSNARRAAGRGKTGEECCEQ